MAKKLLGVAAALLFVALLVSPAPGADFTFGGFYRIRAIASENRDGLDTINGKFQDRDRYIESRILPLLRGSLDDNVTGAVLLQAPFIETILGGGQGTAGGGINIGEGQLLQTAGPSGLSVDPFDLNAIWYWLQFKVPFIPGPWFVRAGRDDIFYPRGILAFPPNDTSDGFEIWGSVGPDVDLRFEIIKHAENSIGVDDDNTNYRIDGTWRPIKNASIRLYEVIEIKNRTKTTDPHFRDYWTGLSLASRAGRFNGTFDFVYQTGDWEFNSAGEATSSSVTGKKRTNVDQTVNAWMLWLSGGVTLGPANVTLNYVEASGDSDQEDNTQNQFYAISCQTDDFVLAGCDARVQGPTNLWFGDKYENTSTQVVGSRNIGGNTGGAGGRYARGNGTRVVSGDFSLSPLKDVVFNLTLGFIWSNQARPDLSLAGTNPFVRDTYIGSEIDTNVVWTVYPGFTLQGGFDYLARGDFGILRNEVATDAQVAGGRLGSDTRLVNSSDNSWQAVFVMQWLF